MNRLSATIDTSGFGRADLVIEAVFEDLDLKRRVLAEVEEAAGDDCVVASNTSSIPIARPRPRRAAAQPHPGHALLLAGGEDAAAGGDRHARDRRLGDRDRGGLRPAARQTRHRRARRPGVLHHARAVAVHERGRAPGRGGRCDRGRGRGDEALRLPGRPPGPARRGRHRRRGQGGGRAPQGVRRAHDGRRRPWRASSRAAGWAGRAAAGSTSTTAARSASTSPCTRCCRAACPARRSSSARSRSGWSSRS